MATLDAFRGEIHRAVSSRFPHFPVTVDTLPDDSSIFCVHVFAVPADQVAAVKAGIREESRHMFPGGDYMLLPMVRNLAVTRQHYPEYLPCPVEPAWQPKAETTYRVGTPASPASTVATELDIRRVCYSGSPKWTAPEAPWAEPVDMAVTEDFAEAA